MSDIFRSLKTAMAYSKFESSDIAGAFFKLIDCLEGDIVTKYEPSEKTVETIEELSDAIATYNEEQVEAEDDTKYIFSDDDDEEELTLFDDDIDDALDQEEDEEPMQDDEEDSDAYIDEDESS